MHSLIHNDEISELMKRYYILVLAFIYSLLACSREEIEDVITDDDEQMGVEATLTTNRSAYTRAAIDDNNTKLDPSWTVLVRAFRHATAGDRSMTNEGLPQFNQTISTDLKLATIDEPLNKTVVASWGAGDLKYGKWKYLWNAKNTNGTAQADGKGSYTVSGYGTFSASGDKFIDVVAIGCNDNQNSWTFKFGSNGGEAYDAGCAPDEFVSRPWSNLVSYKSINVNDIIEARTFDLNCTKKPVIPLDFKHVMTQIRFVLKSDRVDTVGVRFDLTFAHLPLWGIYDYMGASWRNVTSQSRSDALYLNEIDGYSAAKISLGDTVGTIIIPGDYTAGLMEYGGNETAYGNTSFVLNNPLLNDWGLKLTVYTPDASEWSGYKTTILPSQTVFGRDVFEAGHVYIYNLNYTPEGIYIDPLSVLDWNESDLDSDITLQ